MPKREGHKFKSHKGCSLKFCDNCGLVPLNNRISRICIEDGCQYEQFSRYQQWKRNGYKFSDETHPNFGVIT